MAAFDRCKKCLRVGKTFYGKTFEELVDYLRSADKRTQFEIALKNDSLRQAGKLPEYAPVSCNYGTRAGIRISKLYWFVRTCEFLRRFDFKPKTLGIKTVTLLDELGICRIEGCLIEPQADALLWEYRNCEIWSEHVREISEHVTNPRSQLRKNEPAETFLAMNKKDQKEKLPADSEFLTT